jgi:DNA-binding response OmpR family regulator
MGGHVWAYSELGVGSTFTVYLPAIEPEPDRAETRSSTEEETRGTETVLWVEDEHMVRRLVRRFLESRGYTVLEASGGPEALRISRQHSGPIHLMVTDIVMPRMSGRELAFQLETERPDMKVLYMSGHTEDAIIHHGIQEKGLAFLQKPFAQRVLLDRVRALLSGQPEPESKDSPEGGAGENEPRA